MITNQNCRWRFTGDGVTTAFSFDNIIWETDDLAVYVNGVKKTLGVDYSVAGLAQTNGGTVTFNTAPANATDVLIVSAIDATQQLHYAESTEFPSAATETELDRLTRLVQQLLSSLTRVLTLPAGDPDGTVVALPAAATRAGQVLGFDIAGNPTALSTLPAASVSAAMAPVILAATTKLAAAAMGVVPALSPMQFGAAGDGVTDDSAAIAAMLGAADTLQAAGTNAIVDGGGYTFATTQPLVATINTTFRNLRLKALPSAAWVGRQVPASTSTNGLFTVPAGAGNIYFENCFADCQGVAGGTPQTTLVPNVNGYCISSTAIGRIRFSNCQGTNPSPGCAIFYTLGKCATEQCIFTCLDTLNQPTYTGYAVCMDYLWTGSGSSVGSGDTSFVGLRAVHGLVPIFVAAGVFHVFFVADTHFWTAGGGPLGFLGADIWGQGIHFDDCYVDGAIRYNTGGIYNNGVDNTQLDADLTVNNSLLTGHGLPPLELRATVANSVIDSFRWTSGQRGPNAAQLLFSNPGNWNLPAALLTYLNTVHNDLEITSGPKVVTATAGGTQAMKLNTTHANTCVNYFTATGYTSPYAGSVQAGATFDDHLAQSADGKSSFKVCSANSVQAPATGALLNANASGTIGGLLVAFTAQDPNNTTSYFAAYSGNGTTRYKVWSNGNVVNTNNSYGAICDMRTKRDVVAAPPVGDRLAKVKLIEFASEFAPDGERRVDFSAQQLRGIFPELVAKDGKPDAKGRHLLSVHHSRLPPLLVQAWQEERAYTRRLEKRLARLEARR